MRLHKLEGMKKLVLYSVVLQMSLITKAQPVLSLQDAVNIALKNSLDIQLGRNNLEANTILNNFGVAGGLPLITGSASNTEQVTSVNQLLNNGTEIKRNAAAA